MVPATQRPVRTHNSGKTVARARKPGQVIGVNVNAARSCMGRNIASETAVRRSPARPTVLLREPQAEASADERRGSARINRISGPAIPIVNVQAWLAISGNLVRPIADH
jgi:hypothetical protein